jgi:hypothetical protein
MVICAANKYSAGVPRLPKHSMITKLPFLQQLHLFSKVNGFCNAASLLRFQVLLKMP